MAEYRPAPASVQSQDKEGELIETLRELIEVFGERRVYACLEDLAKQATKSGSVIVLLAVLQAVIREIALASNPQLEAEVIALGTGVLLTDKQTMGSIAAKHGLTKQAVSKRVIAFCDKWQLPPSTFMRSTKDRITYAKCNKPRET